MNAEAIGDLASDLKSGVLHRLVGGGQSQVNEAAHLAGLFFFDELKRVEVLDLGGEADGMAGEIECGDLGHTALAGHEAVPELRRGITDPADESEAGYDDTTLKHCYLVAFWFFS